MAARMTVVGDYKGGNLRQAGKDLNYIEAQAQGFSKSFMAGFAGIGASIGGLVALQSVVSLIKDTTQAAMDDQVAMASLGKTLENVGQGFKQTGVEDFISKMQLASGVADNDLRNAFQKLVTVTGDVEKSQTALKLAMDISAGTGKDLESVSAALAKGYGGQVTALQRLGVGIDAATLKSKNMGAITDALSSKFTGQAAVAAGTYQGQMNRITQAVGEAQEAIGYALLDAVDRLIGKMGGVGGLQSAILGAGNQIADFVDDVSLTIEQVDKLGRALVSLSSGGLVKADAGFSLFGETLKAILQTILQILGGPAVALTSFLEDIGVISSDASDGTSELALANEHGARASMQAAKGISGLGDDTEDAGKKAWEAAKGYFSFYSAIAAAAQIQRDIANTSGTVSSAIAAGFSGKFLKGPGEFVKLYGEAKKAADDLGSSAGGAGSSVEKLTAAQQKAADQAKQFASNVESLGTSLSGLVQEVSGATADAGAATFEKINGQIDAFKSALSEAKSFAQGIVSSFMGNLDLGAALDAAKSAGTSIVEEFVKQGDRAKEFGTRMKELLAAGLSKDAMQDIMALGFDRGLDVMKQLQDGNIAQNIAGINDVYSSVATMANSVADQAKSVFYDAGLNLMLTMLRAMIEELMPNGKTRKRLLGMMDDLAAAMNRNVTIGISVVGPGASAVAGAVANVIPIPSNLTPTESSDFIDGVLAGGGMPGFANGGIAMSPTFGVFGEAGPEALIPLDRMGGMAPTYNINVTAGVGDPRAIGKSVVEAITLFERSSGPVFARA